MINVALSCGIQGEERKMIQRLEGLGYEERCTQLGGTGHLPECEKGVSDPEGGGELRGIRMGLVGSKGVKSNKRNHEVNIWGVMEQ